MSKQNIVKVTRTLLRLKHTLAFDAEINEVLPDTLLEFESAVQRGELKEIGFSLEDALGLKKE